MFLPIGIDAYRDVGGLVRNRVVVAHLDHDRVQEDDGIDGVERPGLPGLHLLQHTVSDPRDRLVRQFGAIDLPQMVLDVADGHAVRVQTDDHVVQAAGDPPGPLGDQHRGKRARPVPRHIDLDRAHPRLLLFEIVSEGWFRLAAPRRVPGRVLEAVDSAACAAGTVLAS